MDAVSGQAGGAARIPGAWTVRGGWTRRRGPIGTIDRTGCRARAEQRFSADRMVADRLHDYWNLSAAIGGW